MLKKLCFSLVLLISSNCFSQISFEKGYFIDNNTQKFDGLIENLDWKNNPDHFSFKSSENEIEETLTLKNVMEFGVGEKSKYIRRVVDVDRSGEQLKNLGGLKEPQFEKEELFLKVLVEGKASLYLFEDGNLKRYFFSVDGATIEPLIYKRYKSSANLITKNEEYKQQLWNNLKCEDISLQKIKKVDYRSEDLISLFVKYNQCSKAEFKTFDKKEKKDLFNLTLRPGVNSTSLSIENNVSPHIYTDFGNEVNFRFGIEAEIIMPFNRNKWSVLIEPTYQYFNSEIDRYTYVEYQSIELPLGIRHYFFLNNTSKLFINGSLVLDKSLGSEVNRLEIRTVANLAFGAGYNYNNKYSLELRYFTNRDIFVNYRHYMSDYRTVSVIFGYTLF